jgi:threonine dehydrogenase-like Zn-dependent dehydrogenase
MKAAVFRGNGELSIDDAPEPHISLEGDVLIEVEMCGLCGSDVAVLDVPPRNSATPGTILGHEFVGHVVQVGEAVRDLRPGQRVVVDPDPKCGDCQSCRAGFPGGCTGVIPLGARRDGALARLVTAPASAAFPIAEGIPAEVAALAEPLACVINATNRLAVRTGESAIIFGAGAIGCLFTAVLNSYGVSPILVVEPSEARRHAAEALGATAAVPPMELAAAQQKLLPTGANVVVDAVGKLFAEAISAAAPGGRIALFGMDSGAEALIRQKDITKKSLTVIGTYITNFTFPSAISLIEAETVDFSPIITDIFSLDNTSEGIKRIREGDAIKVSIRPE